MIKNLMDKLHTHEPDQASVPQVPRPPVPRPPPDMGMTIHDSLEGKVPDVPASPAQDKIPHVARERLGGRKMLQDDEGIIIDLGEGISLNVPIQRRMSLGDFLKVAEKVKALEMLSEDIEYKKN